MREAALQQPDQCAEICAGCVESREERKKEGPAGKSQRAACWACECDRRPARCSGLCVDTRCVARERDKYLGLPSLSERAEAAVVVGPPRRAMTVLKASGAPGRERITMLYYAKTTIFQTKTKNLTLCNIAKGLVLLFAAICC